MVQAEAVGLTTLAEAVEPVLLDKIPRPGQTHHMLAEAILRVKDSPVGTVLNLDTQAAVLENLVGMVVLAHHLQSLGQLLLMLAVVVVVLISTVLVQLVELAAAVLGGQILLAVEVQQWVFLELMV